jgi:CubicO group peptidase (beta-lactamase class C family)
MKKIGWLIGLLLIAGSFLVPGQEAAKKDESATPSGRMDKLFDFWNRLDQPGFGVVVVKEGRVLYQKVFGLACQEHAVPLTLNSVFNVAAAAQPFVGQAVALLEKQGRLFLDDDVRKLIPELPDFGTPVRLRHLLFHSSGLRDWLPVLQLAGRDKEEVTIDRVLKIVQAQKKPIFTPGERTQFSNTDYDLLAETIKRAAGKPFSEWAWENVFKPLKMTRTQFRDNFRSIFDDQAFTYNYTRQEYLKGIDTLSLSGSHSLFTSIADLSKWLISIETGQAVGPGVYEKMFTPGRLNDGSSSGFGYGWGVENEAGRKRVVASGTWAGSGAVAVYYPDHKFGFAVLANWDYTSVEGFASDIVDIYLPAPAPPARAVPPAAAGKNIDVSPQKLDRYVGDYRLGPAQILTFTRDGGRLFFQIPGQRFVLTALSETEFLLDFAAVRISFQADKDGKVHQLVWRQGGTEQIAPKIVLVKPTPADLKEFAGTYFNDELNLRFRLEARGETLVISAPDSGEARLAPDEKDRFTTRTATLPLIVFQRDAQNRIVGFTIDGEAVRDLIFKKD